MGSQQAHKGFGEILHVLITGVLLVEALLLYSSPSSAAPSVTWSPTSVAQEIDAGDSKTITASKDLLIITEFQPYLDTRLQVLKLRRHSHNRLAVLAEQNLYNIILGLCFSLNSITMAEYWW